MCAWKINSSLATKCDDVFKQLRYTCLLYTCYSVLLGRLDGVNKHRRDSRYCCICRLGTDSVFPPGQVL